MNCIMSVADGQVDSTSSSLTVWPCWQGANQPNEFNSWEHHS